VQLTLAQTSIRITNLSVTKIQSHLSEKEDTLCVLNCPEMKSSSLEMPAFNFVLVSFAKLHSQDSHKCGPELKTDWKVKWDEVPRYTPGAWGENYGLSRRTSRGPIDSSLLKNGFYLFNNYLIDFSLT
jgi:hypothetical protein